MKMLLRVLVVSSVALPWCVRAADAPADWMTELPFADVFRTSRTWVSQKKGAAWGQGPELALDEFGVYESLPIASTPSK